MWEFPGGSVVKNPPADSLMQEVWIWRPDWENPLEKEMATCSRILAWKIPWTKQPGGYSHVAQIITYAQIKIYVINN